MTLFDFSLHPSLHVPSSLNSPCSKIHKSYLRDFLDFLFPLDDRILSLSDKYEAKLSLLKIQISYNLFLLYFLPLLPAVHLLHLLLTLHPRLILCLPVRVQAAPHQVLLLTGRLPPSKTESILDRLDCHSSVKKTMTCTTVREVLTVMITFS